MLAFENNKRSTQDTVNEVEHKKRKVEFSDEVVLHQPQPDQSNDKHLVQTMYRRYVFSALDDLEKVCFKESFCFCEYVQFPVLNLI